MFCVGYISELSINNGLIGNVFLLPDVRILLPFSRYSIAVKFAVQQNSIWVRIANGSFVNNMAALYEIALYITGYLSCFMLKYQEQMPFKSLYV